MAKAHQELQTTKVYRILERYVLQCRIITWWSCLTNSWLSLKAVMLNLLKCWMAYCHKKPQTTIGTYNSRNSDLQCRKTKTAYFARILFSFRISLIRKFWFKKKTHIAMYFYMFALWMLTISRGHPCWHITNWYLILFFRHEILLSRHVHFRLHLWYPTCRVLRTFYHGVF